MRTAIRRTHHYISLTVARADGHRMVLTWSHNGHRISFTDEAAEAARIVRAVLEVPTLPGTDGKYVMPVGDWIDTVKGIADREPTFHLFASATKVLLAAY